MGEESINTITLEQARRFDAGFEKRLALRNSLYECLLSDLKKVQDSKSNYDTSSEREKQAKKVLYIKNLEATETRLNLIHERRNKWVHVMNLHSSKTITDI